METEALSQVYDRFAESYDRNRDAFDIEPIISAFQKKLAVQSGYLLDLGCGSGVPLAQSFVQLGWDVTGVDFSKRMLSLAQDNVPEMNLIHSDICSVVMRDEQFDAVTAIYSLFHIPRDRHEELLRKIHGWLKSDGLFLFTYATEEYTGEREFEGYKEFMGEKLFYSHDQPETLYQLLDKVGFTIETTEKHTVAGETFLWITVQK